LENTSTRGVFFLSLQEIKSTITTNEYTKVFFISEFERCKTKTVNVYVIQIKKFIQLRREGKIADHGFK